MKKHSEKMWVIVHEHHGLYVGSGMTRAAMISEHVVDRLSGMTVEGVTFPVMHKVYGGGLTDDHRRAWAWSKKRGDRCVRATVTW